MLGLCSFRAQPVAPPSPTSSAAVPCQTAGEIRSAAGGFKKKTVDRSQLRWKLLDLATADQRQELVPGLLVLAKDAQHRARRCHRVLLLDAPHHHAEMPRFDDDADALRAQPLLDGVRDLAGQPLLNLQAP